MKPNRELDTADAEAAQDALFDAVLALKTRAEAQDFFKDLCTPAELQALTDRWTVVEPLIQGVPYRDIANTTGVSVTTIGRVARFLTQGNGGYQRVFDRISSTQSARRKNEKK